MGLEEREERPHRQSRVTSKDGLKTRAIGALRRLQKLPGLVRGFFVGPAPAIHHRRGLNSLSFVDLLTNILEGY